MNKNSVIGIILIIGVLIGWMIWVTPSKEEIARQRHIQDSIYQANRERYIQDSIRFAEAQKETEMFVAQDNDAESSDAVTRDKYGVFASVATGEEQLYTIENDVMRITLTSKGGYVKTVELKDYKTWDSLPLIGFDENTSKFNLSFFASNRNINTIDLYFAPYLNNYPYDGDGKIVVGEKPLTFSFRAFADNLSNELNPNQYIEFTYILTKDEYMMDFDVKTINMKNVIASNTHFVTIDWYVDLLKQEKAVDRYNGSTVYYKFLSDDVESLSGSRGGEKDDEKDLRSNLKWMSFKQRFFSYSLIAKESFNSAVIGMKTDYRTQNPRYLKTMYASVDVPFDGLQENNTMAMQFYFGPNSLKIMDKYGIDLDKQIPLGGKFVGWINRYIVVNVFNWLGSYGWNYDGTQGNRGPLHVFATKPADSYLLCDSGDPCIIYGANTWENLLEELDLDWDSRAEGANRHLSRANCAFIDGHVASRPLAEFLGAPCLANEPPWCINWKNGLLEPGPIPYPNR